MVTALLLELKLEALGNRRLPEYLLARLQHRLHTPTVMLPLILPAEQDTIVITDLDGNEIAQIGGD